jgi:hypothetical protein
MGTAAATTRLGTASKTGTAIVVNRIIGTFVSHSLGRPRRLRALAVWP